jgi:hypothetical protein
MNEAQSIHPVGKSLCLVYPAGLNYCKNFDLLKIIFTQTKGENYEKVFSTIGGDDDGYCHGKWSVCGASNC